jgi:hypothetical protein
MRAGAHCQPDPASIRAANVRSRPHLAQSSAQLCAGRDDGAVPGRSSLAYAKSYGEKELSEARYSHVYYWKIEPNGCALIGPSTAECVLLLYKEVEVLNYDPSSIANDWRQAIYLLGVYYEYQGPELGYRARLGQIGDWSVGPWKWL